MAAEREPRLGHPDRRAGDRQVPARPALLGDVADEATTVVGRCLSYGDGITYWPVAEIVRALAGAPSEAAVAALVDGESPTAESELIAARRLPRGRLRLRAVSVEEAQWAFRKLVERIARDRPLVVAVEDIHWAEPASCDCSSTSRRSPTAVPVLLVCLAGPSCRTHPAWGSAVRARALPSRARAAATEERGGAVRRTARGRRADQRGPRGAPDRRRGNPVLPAADGRDAAQRPAMTPEGSRTPSRRFSPPGSTACPTPSAP